jgi:hypothetical protein
MPGDNQHFIPKHLLKGFAIRHRPKFTWEYRAGSGPEQKRLKKLAAAHQYYSEPRADGGKTLDDDITDYENGLAQRISALRSDPPGALADSAVAAEIVTHLTIRNDNVRGSLTYGFKLMMREAFGLVGEAGGVRRLLGLDSREPSQRFKDRVMRPILEHPGFRKTGLPEAVVTRVAFGLAREHLPAAFERESPALRAMLAHLHQSAGTFVRTSHNNALAEGMVPDVRAAALALLSWSVIETPFNIILPDCVAIGITKDGEARALFLTETDALAIAVMALSSNRLLVGRTPDAAAFEPSLFNLHAIACSEQFFVSAVTSAELTEWSRYIGVRSRTVLHQSLAEAFAEFAPPIIPPSAPEPSTDTDPGPTVKPAPLPSFGIHFLGCADQPTSQKIADAVSGAMAGLVETIPLARLDGITFAADYPAALANLDRGFATPAPLTTSDEQDAVGVAMAPAVLRDGVVKVHIVLRDYLGHALISDDEATQKSALQILVGQFAEVGCVELFDSAIPGVMLKPLENPFDMLRYRHVANAWNGYFSARVSAGFAPKVGEGHRTLLIAAIRRAAEEIPQLRLEYRFHGDVPRLMNTVLKHVAYILSHAARLIGHYDGLEDVAMDADGLLATELNKLGLEAWFDHYHRDLRTLWDRRGKWASMEEFLALGHHVERLPWQFGLFLWQTPDGTCRLEAPLHIDRPRLQVEVQKHPLRTLMTIARNLGRRLLRRP